MTQVKDMDIINKDKPVVLASIVERREKNNKVGKKWRFVFTLLSFLVFTVTAIYKREFLFSKPVIAILLISLVVLATVTTLLVGYFRVAGSKDIKPLKTAKNSIRDLAQ